MGSVGLANLTRFAAVVPLGDREFLPVFSSLPLDKLSDRVDRAVIAVHGANQNANRHFCDVLWDVQKLGRRDSVLVIAPCPEHPYMKLACHGGFFDIRNL